MPVKIDRFMKSTFRFVNKQERTTRLILAVVGIIIAFFLPPLIFLLAGVTSGSALYHASLSSPGEEGGSRTHTTCDKEGTEGAGHDENEDKETNHD